MLSKLQAMYYADDRVLNPARFIHVRTTPLFREPAEDFLIFLHHLCRNLKLHSSCRIVLHEFDTAGSFDKLHEVTFADL